MKLAAFQLVNGRVIVGRVDPEDYQDDPSYEEQLKRTHIVHGPHEFAFVRGRDGQPSPAMMPYSVIPHVGEGLLVLPLQAIHVVVWEWSDAAIEALYTKVTSGLDLATTMPDNATGKSSLIL